MGFFRFRRSIKILPGARWNLNKRGSSITVGGRGLKHTFGSNGSRTTVGIPGSGLSYTQVHSSGAKPTLPSGNSGQIPQARKGNGKNFFVIGIIVVGIWLAGKFLEGRFQPSAKPNIAPASAATAKSIPLSPADSEAITRETSTKSGSFTGEKSASQPALIHTDETLPSMGKSGGARIPRVLPTGISVDKAQARAVAIFPQLGVSGSLLNRFFLARVRRYQIERPEVFDDPDWPTIIARESEANIK